MKTLINKKIINKMCDFFSGCQIENPILSIKYGMKESW